MTEQEQWEAEEKQAKLPWRTCHYCRKDSTERGSAEAPFRLRLVYCLPVARRSPCSRRGVAVRQVVGLGALRGQVGLLPRQFDAGFGLSLIFGGSSNPRLDPPTLSRTSRC